MNFTIAKRKLYRWRPGRPGSYKNLMTFAWYMLIEKDSEVKQIQTALWLNLLILAGRKHGLNNKLMDQMSTSDWLAIDSALHHAFINEETREKTELFLIKSIVLLSEHNLTTADPVVIAIVLDSLNLNNSIPG